MGVLHASDQKLYNDIIQSIQGGHGLQYAFSVEYLDAFVRSPAALLVSFTWILCILLVIIWTIAGWGTYRVLNSASRFRSSIAAFIFRILSVLAYGVGAVLADQFILGLIG